MALERKWLAVTATPLTSSGTPFGVVTVADTAGFRTKQQVILISSTKDPIQLQVQEVVSRTQLILGPVGPKVGRENFKDISGYTVADSASIAAPQQEKNNIPDKDHYSAIYESDPVVADRVILVDQYGRLYGDGNPLPIAFDGTIAIGDVTIKDSNGDQLQINPDGSINVNITASVGGTNVVRNKFNSITALTANMAVTLVTYTVPFGKKAILQRAVVSGENIAKYTLSINGNLQATLRTYFGGELNAFFEFITGQDNGLVLASGDVITVEVIHGRPQLADFEGRIQIYEVTL